MTRDAVRDRIGFLVAAVMIVAVLVGARRYRPEDAPFQPRDDGEVLEHLAAGSGADPQADGLRALEAELARAPNDLYLAARVARAHIEAARATGDARRLSYAEAALAPFWHAASPPPAALLLRATIRQSRHEFEPALADLDLLLATEPKNAQALLTRASVLVVLARYDEARQSCDRLRGNAAPLVEAVCATQVEGVTGRGAAARARLATLAAAPGVSAADRAWASSVDGEAALYGGDIVSAERALRAALEADRADAYSRGLLCDLLLDAGRDAEVLGLVGVDEPNETLLLRRAIAAKRTHAPDADSLARRLKERDADLRARGDGSHRREEALRLLALEGDGQAALEAAKLDFAAQQEPWDARVLLESAAAVTDPARRGEALAAAAPALTWLKASGCAWPPLRRAAATLEAK